MGNDREKTSGSGWTVNVPVVVFVCLLGLVFLAGGLLGLFGMQPMRLLGQGFVATYVLISELNQSRPEILLPIEHPGSGVVVYDRSRASGGLTLVQGQLPGGPQIRLIDMEGREVHRWKVDFFAAWPDPTHIYPRESIPQSNMHYHTQGFHMRPDGSVLVVVGGLGAVNLSRCGEVLWTVDRMVHHAVTPSGDGGFYLPGHKPINQVDDRFLPDGVPRAEVEKRLVHDHPGDSLENTILKIDDAGRPLETFSVLGAIYDAGLDSVISDARASRPLDPGHLNDIEIVTPALAGKIPGVDPGDLLISLRNMSLLAILDRDDGSLHWSKRGPWVHQHDPDITPDGSIELFNNRSRLGIDWEAGSQILAYDPATDNTEVLHPVGSADRFRSEIMGAHQRLPNGNRLIVESTAGRVFEVTPGGDVVWSYVLPYDKEYASLIELAERVPEDFFTVTDWACE